MELIGELSDIEYGIKNYDNKSKYEAKNENCERIKKCQIICLKEYNI